MTHRLTITIYNGQVRRLLTILQALASVIRLQNFDCVHCVVFSSCELGQILTLVYTIQQEQGTVAVLGWGQGGTGPPNLAQAPPPKFLIGSVVHCFY